MENWWQSTEKDGSPSESSLIEEWAGAGTIARYELHLQNSTTRTVSLFIVFNPKSKPIVS